MIITPIRRAPPNVHVIEQIAPGQFLAKYGQNNYQVTGVNPKSNFVHIAPGKTWEVIEGIVKKTGARGYDMKSLRAHRGTLDEELFPASDVSLAKIMFSSRFVAKTTYDEILYTTEFCNRIWWVNQDTPAYAGRKEAELHATDVARHILMEQGRLIY